MRQRRVKMSIIKFSFVTLLYTFKLYGIEGTSVHWTIQFTFTTLYEETTHIFFVALKQAPTESKSAFLCNGMGSYPNRAVHFNSELATCF